MCEEERGIGEGIFEKMLSEIKLDLGVNTMKIIIERHSVCMGDDCLAPHTKQYALDDDATYIELFECIKNDNYLPSVSGNNVVWVLSNDNYSCIFSYFTKTDKIFVGLEEKFLKEICKGSKKFTFKYYSSPQIWKESIYRMYNDDEYSLWKDRWLDEIEYCDYLMN